MAIPLTPDKTVPYPDSLEPEVATTLRENMQIAANTADLLSGLRGQDPLVQDAVCDGAGDVGLAGDVGDAGTAGDDQAKADEVFKQFAQRAQEQFEQAMAPEPKRGRGRPRKPVPPPVAVNPPALYEGNVAQRISAMLREYNNPIVADAAELRQVVTNKLLDLSMCGDPKIEIKAAEMLGKISDVGLFTEKTEITVTYNSVSDLDQAIKDKVRKMLNAHAIDVTPVELDIANELAPEPPAELIEDASVQDVEDAPPAAPQQEPQEGADAP